MINEIEIDSVSLSIQELGIHARAYYHQNDNKTHAEVRRYENHYELWFSADISNMKTKYLQNYAEIDLTEEQLIQLRDLIDRKLKE